MPSLIIWFIIAAFATYYPALVIAREDGPWGVFDKLRARWNTGYLGKGIRCPVCVSAYVSIPWSILLVWRLGVDPWLFPVIWLSLAGGATFLNKVWLR